MEKALFKKYKLIFIYSFLLFSLCLTQYRLKQKKEIELPEKNVMLTGKVLSFSFNSDTLQMIVKNHSRYLVTYFIKGTQELNEFKKILQYEDEVKIEGILLLPPTNTNPYQFSYRNYLKSIGITYQIKATNIRILKHTFSLKSKIKNRVKRRIESIDKKDQYMKLFILGDSSAYDKIAYQQLGVQHLFCISGMHFSCFIQIFELFFYSKKKAKRIAFPFLCIYAYILGMTYSLIRVLSCLLFQILKKEDFFLTTHDFLLLLFSMILFLFPYAIYNSGFLYSFIISDALIYYQKRWKADSRIKRLLFISTIAFFVSLPITLNQQYEIIPMSILFNIIYVPLISMIIFPLTLITFLIPFCYPLYQFFIIALEHMNAFFLTIPQFTFIIGKPTFLFMIVYWFLFQLSFYLKWKSIFICYFLLFLFLIVSIQFQDPKMVMFDVGQGDAFLIHGTKTILIDTGGSMFSKTQSGTQAKNIIIPYLKGIGKTKIDLLILSHGDLDHIGASFYLVEHFKVDRIIFNCGEKNELEKELIELLKKKRIVYDSCVRKVNIGNYQLQFLNTTEKIGENDNSSVIFLHDNHNNFLFMGDAGIEREKDILGKYHLKNIDFLKVGHHGSNTSSSKSFIQTINPKYSLISVGKNNRYGHPKASVLDTLSESKIYRTDQDGSIVIKRKKNGYQIKTGNT